MAIITISRGSYSKGKEVAEKVAQKLGYKCYAREVVLEASKEFNIPEIKLVQAIHDAPSILERFSYGKEKFIAYFQAALFEVPQEGQRGLSRSGRAFLSQRRLHVLKVRIIADMKTDSRGYGPGENLL